MQIKPVYLTIILVCIMIYTWYRNIFYDLTQERFLEQDDFLVIDDLTNITIFNLNSTEFLNQTIAYEILSQIDFNKPIPSKKSVLHSSHLKIIKNDEYCINSLKHFISHPEAWFKERNIFIDYRRNTIPRKAVSQIGIDVLPKIDYFISKKYQPLFKLKYSVGLFFATEYLHETLIFGTNFGCSHQLYNKLLRTNSLANKAEVAQFYNQYMELYKNKSECVPQYVPESFKLHDIVQCKQFFKYIKSDQHFDNRKGNVEFIKKDVGKHMGKGVSLLTVHKEEELAQQYDFGARCGRIKNSIQIQRYISNPLLLDGHKFDFRVYMLIASLKPTIVYFHDGFLRVSLEIYNPDSKNKTTHFTNTHLADEIFEIARKNGTYHGMTEKELRDYQSWNFTRFKDYLIKTGLINDTNWLDNHLRHHLKKAIIHIIRATNEPIIKTPNTYGLWGMDFMMDDNLNLWFIEANPRPALKGSSEEKKIFSTNLMKEHVKIMFGFLRSRLNRVTRYINELTLFMTRENLNENQRKELIKLKINEFDNINTNYLETEYEPKNISFHKIIDENYDDINRYSGFVPIHCFNP